MIWIAPRKVLKKPAWAIVRPSLEMRDGMKVGKKEAYRSVKKCPAESTDSLNPELSVRKRRKVLDVMKKGHSFR